MPLRDHFRPPLSDRHSWEGFHGGWPMMIVLALRRGLPAHYVAEPQVHLGSAIEVDVATFEEGEASRGVGGARSGGGGVATAPWAPPRPTLTITSDIGEPAEYEVRVYDMARGRRLVAAVEIVSPANKDRPEHRRAFVTKCAAMLQNQVSVAIVDLVTIRSVNLYGELMDSLGQDDPSLAEVPTNLYAVACRYSKNDGRPGLLETWSHPLAIGRPLPTLPLWLAPDLAVPLELEPIYEETCWALQIS